MYPALIVKYVGGDPRIEFYNKDQEKIAEISVSSMNVEQIHKVLQEKGLKMEEPKPPKPVPENVIDGGKMDL